ADPARLGRYSFLTAAPSALVRAKGRRTELVSLAYDAAFGRVTERIQPGGDDALGAARALLETTRVDPVPGLPPFLGGLAGFIGYDSGAPLERLPFPRYDDLGIPDFLLGLYEWVIAWDHGASRAWIAALAVDESEARRTIGMVRERLSGPVRRA